jgi:hypothetical protein
MSANDFFLFEQHSKIAYIAVSNPQIPQISPKSSDAISLPRDHRDHRASLPRDVAFQVDPRDGVWRRGLRQGQIADHTRLFLPGRISEPD